MSARFVSGQGRSASLATLAFVIVLQLLPVPRRRGRPGREPVPRAQPQPSSQRDELTKQFGLDRSTGDQFVHYLEQTAQLNLGRTYTDNQPVCDGDQAQGAGRRSRSSASRRCCRRSSACCSASPRRGEDARRPTTRVTTLHDGDLLDARLLARACCCSPLFAVALGWFPVGGHRRPDLGRHRAREARRPGASTCSCPCAHADARLPGRVRAHHALVAARHDARGLPRARAGEGPARRRSCATATRCRTRCCRWSTLIAINFGFVLSGAIAVEAIFSWPGLGLATYDALKGPDLPMLQGLFLVFSAVGDRLQPARRPALRLPRSAGADRVSAVAVLASRAADRLAAPAARARRGAWREYRRDTGPGWSASRSSPCSWSMALAAPLLADPAGLHAVNTTAQPGLGAARAPSSPLGTDHLGRSVLTQFDLGRAHQPARRPGRHACWRWSSARSSAITAGFFGGWIEAVADAGHRVVPRHPVPAAGDRRSPRSSGRRSRNIILVIGITSWPGTARRDPGAGADAEGARSTSIAAARSARPTGT